MNANTTPEVSGCPSRKLKYRFTCFIARGDLDDPASYSDGDDLTPDTHKSTKGRGAETERHINFARCAEKEEGKDVEMPRDDEVAENCSKSGPGRQITAETAPALPKDPAAEALEQERRLVALGYLPRDGNDPLIYSRVVGVSPRSFLTTTPEYSAKAPPPTYLSDTEMMAYTNYVKSDFLKGFAIPPEGGLMCVDPEINKRFSGVFADVIKQLITTLSIDRMSLPVRMFEPKSMCERIPDLWRFAPYYLTNAAHSREKVDRFKQVIAFAISGIYCASQQLKAFSPLLGETLQGHYDDGTEVYVEHTSHHPPIAHYLIVGPGSTFKMYAHHQFRINMSGNTLVGQQDGPNTVEFPDGQKITYRYPKFKVHGVVFGKRQVYPSGVMTFEDERNHLRAAIVFNYGKKRGLFSSRKSGTKIDDLDGILYYAKKGSKQPKVSQIKELTDVDMPLGQITGSWLKLVKISGTIFWDIDRVQPYVLQYEKAPLASDWRYREDIIWLRRNNMPYSQEWKTRLEVEQRKDERLRQKKK